MENGALNISPLFGAAIQTHSLTRINARSISFMNRMVIPISDIVAPISPPSPNNALTIKSPLLFSL